MVGLNASNYKNEYGMLGKKLEKIFSLEDIAEMIFHLMQKEGLSIDIAMKIVDIEECDQEKVMPMILKLQSSQKGGTYNEK